VKKNNGIIIKTFFTKKIKIALLDAELGKIEGVPPSDIWCVGSLIEYSIPDKKEHSMLHNMGLVSLPLLLARTDILFFHHILELCNFFIPVGSYVTGMYELISLLYADKAAYYSDQFKLLFLLKFFVLLGRYPENQKFQTSYFHQLALMPIDRIMDYSIDWDTEQELREWVTDCVLDHPYVHVLKTFHFLERDRLL